MRIISVNIRRSHFAVLIEKARVVWLSNDKFVFKEKKIKNLRFQTNASIYSEINLTGSKDNIEIVTLKNASSKMFSLNIYKRRDRPSRHCKYLVNIFCLIASIISENSSPFYICILLYNNKHLPQKF